MLRALELSRRDAWVMLALALILCALIYVPGLGGPLLLDDHSVLVPLLHAPAGQLFSYDYLFGASGPTGRPAAMFSFALNAVSSGADFAAWKLTNVLVHLLCGLVLYAFSVRLFDSVYHSVKLARAGALLVAVAWLVHPLQVSTVLYTVQRMAQLSALFCLLGLWAYSSARLRMQAGRDGGRLILFALLVCTALAGLSKETGLLLPLFCGALEISVFAGVTRPLWLRRSLMICVIAPLVAALVYLVADIDEHLLRAYNRRDFSLGERLLTEARVVVTYLRWIIVPRRADFGFYHDDVTVSRGLTDDAWTPLAIALIAGLIAAAWAWRRRLPLCAFGIALFVLGHALESTIFGLELMFEHRNYLPMAGILIVGVDVMIRTLEARPWSILAAAIVAALLLAAVPRTLLWGDEMGLYRAFLSAHPHSERARVTLAEGYVGTGQLDAALEVATGADGPTLSLERLRILCLRDADSGGAADDVLSRVREQQRLSNFAFDALLYLAGSSDDKSCAIPREPLFATLEAVRRVPGNRPTRYRLHVHLARYYHDRQEVRRAFKRLRTAARLQPRDPFVHYLKAEWLAIGDELEKARDAIANARARGGRVIYPGIDEALSAMIIERAEAHSELR